MSLFQKKKKVSNELLLTNRKHPIKTQTNTSRSKSKSKEVRSSSGPPAGCWRCCPQHSNNPKAAAFLLRYCEFRCATTSTFSRAVIAYDLHGMGKLNQLLAPAGSL